jgi:GT2 family glycosyltransferase
MIDVSVLIVTWNSKDVIKTCIDSVIQNSSRLSVELIIIDNNSSDGTFELVNTIHFENIHTYQNPANVGFTKAVNQAINYSSGSTVFLLNPDTVLHSNAIDELYGFLKRENSYGACAPVLLNSDGSIQFSVRSFPSYWKMLSEFSLMAYILPNTRLFGSWKMKYMDYRADADIEQPMAAAMMLRRDTIDNIGLMDERFEMFFNDVDLCKRVIDGRQKIRLITAAKASHVKGESIYKARERMIRAWNRDCYEYFKKYYPNPVLLLWLRINLSITGTIRILLHKIFEK